MPLRTDRIRALGTVLLTASTIALLSLAPLNAARAGEGSTTPPPPPPPPHGGDPWDNERTAGTVPSTTDGTATAPTSLTSPLTSLVWTILGTMIVR